MTRPSTHRKTCPGKSLSLQLVDRAPSPKGPWIWATIWWQFSVTAEDKALSPLEVQGQSSGGEVPNPPGAPPAGHALHPPGAGETEGPLPRQWDPSSEPSKQSWTPLQRRDMGTHSSVPRQLCSFGWHRWALLCGPGGRGKGQHHQMGYSSCLTSCSQGEEVRN